MQLATLHRFHSTTTDLLSIASPSALWTTRPPIDRSQQAPFTQTGSGAWNLTLSARPAFCFYQPFLPWSPRFSPIDPDPNAGCPTRQEPIPTFRSSDGCYYTNPLAGLPSLQSAVLQVIVACLPSHPTRRRMFTLAQRHDSETGDLHLATASYSHLAKPR